MSKKMESLQQALNSSANAQMKPKPEAVKISSALPMPDSSHATSKRSPSREGKENISAWLHPDFKKGRRLVQLRKDGKVYLDDLMAEALNDLFRKYDVPAVIHE